MNFYNKIGVVEDVEVVGVVEVVRNVGVVLNVCLPIASTDPPTECFSRSSGLLKTPSKKVGGGTPPAGRLR